MGFLNNLFKGGKRNKNRRSQRGGAATVELTDEQTKNICENAGYTPKTPAVANDTNTNTNNGTPNGEPYNSAGGRRRKNRTNKNKNRRSQRGGEPTPYSSGKGLAFSELKGGRRNKNRTNKNKSRKNKH